MPPRRKTDTNAPDTTRGRECEKCGGDFIYGPKYHATQLSCPSRSRFRKIAREEHLHFECRCGYDWTEPVAVLPQDDI